MLFVTNATARFLPFPAMIITETELPETGASSGNSGYNGLIMHTDYASMTVEANFVEPDFSTEEDAFYWEDDLSEYATADQRAAFAHFIRFLEAGEGETASRVLSGYAGTGKTWLLVQCLIAALNRHMRVAVCAPTHKAVAVIAAKLKEEITNFDALINSKKLWIGTLHALLGLRLREDRDGGTRLELDRQENGTYFEHYDLVTIDESSMVSNELLSYIGECQYEGRQPRILYVGDPGQLLPIEAADNAQDNLGPLFSQAHISVQNPLPPVFERVKIQHGLQEIVRQKYTGKPHPIVVLAQEIRRYIEGTASGVFTPAKVQTFLAAHADDLGKHVRVAQVSQLAGGAVKMRKKFPNKDVRVVAWRNQVVDQHNAFIHRDLTSLFDVDEKALDAPFWPGEVLVAREAMYVFKPSAMAYQRSAKFWEESLSPILAEPANPAQAEQPKKGRPDDVVMVPNNTEMVVNTCIPLQHPYLDVECWWVNAQMPGEDPVEFFVAGDPTMHRRIVQAAWDDYRQVKRRTATASQRAWTITRACAPAMHAYAMTAHKSQGSTFHYAIVDLNDLYRMVNKSGADAYHRAFYVAVTRASERVWIGV